MSNKPGRTDRFYYRDGNVHMWANTTQTDYHNWGAFTTTEDPRWNIYNSDGKNHLLGREWLFYTLGNERWAAKIHAQYHDAEVPGGSPGINCWLEHRNMRTGEGHDDGNRTSPGKIHIEDWDGVKWEAHFLAIGPPFPGTPIFDLKKL